MATASFASLVAIVTDSAAQVPAELARQLDIHVVPFTVLFNSRDYLNGIELSPQDLYRRRRDETTLPITSAPSMGEDAEAFRDCLKRGAHDALCAALSQPLEHGLQR